MTSSRWIHHLINGKYSYADHQIFLFLRKPRKPLIVLSRLNPSGLCAFLLRSPGAISPCSAPVRASPLQLQRLQASL